MRVFMHIDRQCPTLIIVIGCGESRNIYFFPPIHDRGSTIIYTHMREMFYLPVTSEDDNTISANALHAIRLYTSADLLGYAMYRIKMDRRHFVLSRPENIASATTIVLLRHCVLLPNTRRPS